MNTPRKGPAKLCWKLSEPQPRWDLTFRIPAPSEPRECRGLELAAGALWVEVRGRAPK